MNLPYPEKATRFAVFSNHELRVLWHEMAYDDGCRYWPERGSTEESLMVEIERECGQRGMHLERAR